MSNDAKNLSRKARRLKVSVKRSVGSPPSYPADWQPIFDADVDRIEITAGAEPSKAVVWFKSLRWNESHNLKWGDKIIIYTDDNNEMAIFNGFVVTYDSQFSGGDENGDAFERNAVICADHRWLLKETSPIWGMFARGPDDYTDYGTAGQAAIANSFTFLSGQRAIFNTNGRPNMDPVELELYGSSVPIFAAPANAIPWTGRNMIRYCLSRLYNRAYDHIAIDDAAVDCIGLDHAGFDRVINHIVVDTLSAIEAVDLICQHLGFSFREDYTADGTPKFTFYKIAESSSYSRSSTAATILHRLHAPAPGENIVNAVVQGSKMLWSAHIAEDISRVVNAPIGLGTPDRFEFTAELIPAWKDSQLTPDTSDENANLFKYDDQLEELTDPDSITFYKYYHPSGSSFRRDVGRKWALNESGTYSATTYDRGMPFDFATVIPLQYITDVLGKRSFAPFNRRLLAPLTFDKDTLNPAAIKVEFSFDGGTTWQVIPAMISALQSEAGIYIEEPNLANISDKSAAAIADGDLGGVDLNLFTSLSDDKLNTRVFKDGEWKTRVRVTASIQMDQRLRRTLTPSSGSGSPFYHRGIYDFSEKYGLTARCPSSTYEGSGLSAWNIDATETFDKHLDAIRDANQDMSISGRFTLERLWLDGSQPEFLPGDCIEGVTGRNYSLAASYNGGQVFPEIIKIVYHPDRQRMDLITRDLRFADVVL